jgi:UDP-sulfoquinovose synthase
MQCLTLALEHPPEVGEYRVFNQFEAVYDVTELANKVQKVGDSIGLDVVVRNLENPRTESEEHYYNPDHEHLLKLGYEPTRDIDGEIKGMLTELIKYRGRILARQEALIPDIRWDGTRRKSSFVEEGEGK